MAITPLPTPPLRSDPTNFAARGDAFLGALPQFQTEANALAAAMNLNSTTDTSSSSVLIGTGTKTFVVSSGKSFQPGMYLVLADTSAPSTNSMFGQITSYSGTSLVMSIISVRGSGTITSWVISQSSAGGAQPGANSDITSLASPSLGSATATTQSPGDNSTKVATTAFVAAADVLASAIDSRSKIQSIDYSLAGNALTLKVNNTVLDFRSTTLTSGTPSTISITSQISTVISSGSTGGTTSGIQSDIMILVINNTGTPEVAWCNASGGINLDESTLITTVAEGGTGTADSNNVIYSTTARTSVAFRVVGLFRSTQGTAGAWNASPTLVQGTGGQALAAMSGLGYGQTWQNVTGSRSIGTTYYNTKGRPMAIAISSVGASSQILYISGVAVAQWSPTSGFITSGFGIVPPGGNYVVTGNSFSLWLELS